MPLFRCPSTSTASRRLLPHRYPFLLVDRVVELEPNKRILALKNVSINEPFFQGHFPGHPVMPGVLVLEALAQAGGLLTQLSRQHRCAGKQDKLFYLVKIDNARFSRMVVPGDQLHPRGQAQAHDPQHGPVPAASPRVDGEEVASADILCAEGRS